MAAPTLEELLAASDEDLEAASAAPSLDELLDAADIDPIDSAINEGKGFVAQQRAVAKQLGVGVMESFGGINTQLANTFMIMDHAAKALSEKSGVSTLGKMTGAAPISYKDAFKQVEKRFRREANAQRDYVEKNADDNLTSKALQLLGGLPGGVAEAVLASQTVGLAPGLAALGALSEADKGVVAAFKGAASGYAQGTVFKLMGPPGAGKLATAGGIGSGVAAVSSAFGASPEDAALAGVALGVMGGAGARKFKGSELRTLDEIAASKPFQGPLVEGRPKGSKVLEGEVVLKPEFLGRDYSDLIPADHDIVVKLGKIRTPEDYNRVTNELTSHFKNNMDEARRGTITDQQSLKLAEEVDAPLKKLLGRPIGKNIESQEGAIAARAMVGLTTQHWFATAKKGETGKVTDVDKYEFLRATAIELDTMAAIFGTAAEAGRTLRAFQQPVGPSTVQLKQMRDMINEGSKKGVSTEDFMHMVAQAESPMQLAKLAESMRKYTTKDKFKFLYVNFLVSGPPTHAVNVLSNTSIAFAAIPETFLAASADSIRSGLRVARGQKPATDRVYMREVWARTYGLIQGAKDGLILASKAMKTGRPQMGSKVEQQQTINAIGGPFGAVAGFPTRMLFAEDAFFQSLGYRKEVNARIMRRALGEGKRGHDLAVRVAEMKQDIPEDIHAAAREQGKIDTFTNELGVTGKGFSKLVSNNPLFIFFPFIRTPTNIFKQAVRRSPLWIASEQSRAEVRKGGAARTMELARIGFSSASMMLLVEAMADGRITGSGPSDPELRRVWMTENKPFSIKITNADGSQRWFNYGRIAPLSILMGITADFVSLSGHMTEDERDKIAASLTMSFRKNISNQTFLQGMAVLVKAWEDPERGIPDLAEKVVGSLAVPTFIAQLARVQDPVLKDVQSILDAVKARTPGWSKSVQNQTNIWGEDISFESGLGAGYDFVSPLYSNDIVPDKASEEAGRLQAKFARIPRRFGEFELTPQEYHEASQFAGRQAKEWIDDQVNAATYDAMKQHAPELDPIAREEMEAHYAKARKMAMQHLLMKLLDSDLDRAMKMQTEAKKSTRLARELGILP